MLIKYDLLYFPMWNKHTNDIPDRILCVVNNDWQFIISILSEFSVDVVVSVRLLLVLLLLFDEQKRDRNMNFFSFVFSKCRFMNNQKLKVDHILVYDKITQRDRYIKISSSTWNIIIYWMLLLLIDIFAVSRTV